MIINLISNTNYHNSFWNGHPFSSLGGYWYLYLGNTLTLVDGVTTEYVLCNIEEGNGCYLGVNGQRMTETKLAHDIDLRINGIHLIFLRLTASDGVEVGRFLKSLCDKVPVEISKEIMKGDN